jgi:hypothetical protein
MGASSLPYPQSLNLYAYVSNDPVNASDPTGLQLEELEGDNFWNAVKGVLTVTGGVSGVGFAVTSNPAFGYLGLSCTICYGVVELGQAGVLGAAAGVYMGGVAYGTAEYRILDEAASSKPGIDVALRSAPGSLGSYESQVGFPTFLIPTSFAPSISTVTTQITVSGAGLAPETTTTTYIAVTDPTGTSVTKVTITTPDVDTGPASGLEPPGALGSTEKKD